MKVEKVWKATDTPHGTRLETGPTTPLPDKKLLLFILDRLQKKDTYGVFSEPVDPKELPDYHDIIKHPMDFGTVRKKLDGGVYSSLEAFEADVLLISSNALQYNSPDTIYFRQARSIQELARKDFENLRRESDDSDSQPKVVRRGRPPTKHLKKPISGSPAERAGPEFSSGATLASGEDINLGTNSYNLRKVPTPSKLRVADTPVRASSHRSRNNTEAYSVCSEGKNEFSVSFLKGASVKNGKKQFTLDENRRDTYNQCLLPSGSGYESPVLNALDGEVKQLTVVGLHMKHGYARSLARFAANLGPVAWKIASKKIETVLPAGLEFGPGWVQDNEGSQQDQSCSHVRQKFPLDSVCDVSPSGPPPPSTSCSNSVPTDSTTSGHGNENLGEARGLKSRSNSSSFSSIIGGLTPAAPLKIQKKSAIGPEMNDCGAAAFGFSFPVPTAMTSTAVNSISGGSLVPTQALGMPPGSSNTISSVPARQLDSEGTSSSGGLSRMPPENVCGSSFGHSADAPEMGLYGKPTWQVRSPHHKKDSPPIPPDLNVRFQTAATPPPNSTLQIGSPQQPDLALQL